MTLPDRPSLRTPTVLALACLALLALTLAPRAAAAAEVTVTATEALPGQLARTTYEVVVGPHPLERFEVTRVHRTVGALERPVLLLPPLGNGFSFFEVPTRSGAAYVTSFAGTLALQGYDVWGYTPRTRPIPAGACESGAVDCSPLGDFGLATVGEDVGEIRALIAAERPGVAPVVGGYSLGGMTTLVSLDRTAPTEPRAFAGAMILEGTYYTADPQIRAINAVYCAQAEGALAAGFLWDGMNLPFIKLVGQLAESDPDGLTPLPGFPPGTTNHQVLVALLALPADNPLSPTPEFIRLAGSFEDDEFFYADDERVYDHTELFHDYVPTRLLRDISCSIAGVETAFYDDLGSYSGPLYVLGGGLGFARMQEDTVALTGSSDVTYNQIPEFGHADHWFSPFHRPILELDILSWLNGLP